MNQSIVTTYMPASDCKNLDEAERLVQAWEKKIESYTRLGFGPRTKVQKAAAERLMQARFRVAEFKK